MGPEWKVWFKVINLIERASADVILNDEPTLFSWSYLNNVDYNRNLWVVDKYKHTIFYISKEEETWNAIFKVAGTDYVPG